VADAFDLKPRTRIRLLGPLEILLSGEPVPPGGPRQRALLALLALSVGVAIPPSRLVDVLWGDEPPPSAANTVQVYVSRLRRLLGGAGDGSPLRTVSGMYLLDLPPEAIDARRFELLAESGRSRLAHGDPAGAARELRLALSLWRGTPLPDLADTIGADAALARLESLRLATLADRIDADALLGRHSILIPELEDLVLRHPLDERFVAQLMTALYRDGRQAEAFAAYTSAADRLAEELGVDPGPALRDLHSRLLRQEIVLPASWEQGPASGADDPALPFDYLQIQSPSALEISSFGSSSGVSRQSFIGRVPVQGGGPAIPLARSAPISLPSTSTRLHPTSMVGRTIELAAALEHLRRPQVRLLTLLGPGGAGKTRLAVEAAAARAGDTDTEPVRVVFVPLASIQDAAAIPAEICRILSAEPDWHAEPTMDVAVRALNQQPTLLVLDNLEHLAGPALGVIVELISATDRLSILATSRNVLRLPGEHILALGPLPLPWAGPGARDLDAVLSSDAVRLFVDRARAVLPSFEVTPANVAAIAELCRSLDGLPLAIELAAARIRILPPAEILQRIDRRMELQADDGEHLPGRQPSMWAALDWSVQLLDPTERKVFGQLSVFVGGWSLEAAEQVCGPTSPPEQVIDIVGRLADKSLLVADGSGRLGMLATVRDYARQLLRADRDAADTAIRRHASYYAGLAADLGARSRGWQHSNGGVARIRLEREAGNLTAALEYSAVHDADLLGRLVVGLLDHWFCTGRLREAQRWLPIARRAELGASLRARLLLAFGNLATAGGDPAAADEALAEAAGCALHDDDDNSVLVRVSAARAVAARHLGQPERALQHLTEAIRSICPNDESASIQQSLENELGAVLDDLGRADEALELWQSCRQWGNAVGDPSQIAYPAINLALNAVESLDWMRADALAQEALAAAISSQLPPVVTDVMALAALVDHQIGRQERALIRIREAIRLAHECGRLISLPEMVGLLAMVQAQDDPVVAVRLFAATHAWRRTRSITPVGRYLRSVVDRAELELVQRAPLPAQVSTVEQGRGAHTPFGSLRGLTRLDPGLSPAMNRGSVNAFDTAFGPATGVASGTTSGSESGAACGLASGVGSGLGSGPASATLSRRHTVIDLR
jgi:predicted ATPase/DNA-binding SARP family transcriptional activator